MRYSEPAASGHRARFRTYSRPCSDKLLKNRNPTSVTIAKRPSGEAGRTTSKHDFGLKETRLFLLRDLDRGDPSEPPHEVGLLAHAVPTRSRWQSAGGSRIPADLHVRVICPTGGLARQ